MILNGSLLLLLFLCVKNFGFESKLFEFIAISQIIILILTFLFHLFSKQFGFSCCCCQQVNNLIEQMWFACECVLILEFCVFWISFLFNFVFAFSILVLLNAILLFAYFMRSIQIFLFRLCVVYCMLLLLLLLYSFVVFMFFLVFYITRNVYYFQH